LRKRLARSFTGRTYPLITYHGLSSVSQSLNAIVFFFWVLVPSIVLNASFATASIFFSSWPGNWQFHHCRVSASQFSVRISRIHPVDPVDALTYFKSGFYCLGYHPCHRTYVHFVRRFQSSLHRVLNNGVFLLPDLWCC